MAQYSSTERKCLEIRPKAGENLLSPPLSFLFVCLFLLQPDPSKVGYLSSEQALADYAYLLKYIKQAKRAENSPVIAFGGSYGGMLASWFRIKFPHVCDG